ncbi:sodium transport ATPase [Irpex rosettiformis]|uniref:Sodium transport ATPase n=1 Tax=Irpex rosettiformis TaxID=378272 RepID=A0ACB8UHF6_9APHY|nr:sodium transport ATPase [Irpex rosettiformis]
MGFPWTAFRQKRAQKPPTRSADSQTAALANNVHWLDVNAVVRELKTTRPDGLQDDEASRRLEEYGENSLIGEGGVSATKVLVRQMANALTLVLVAAMAIGYGVQDWVEGGVITAVIALNVGIGFFQEYKAERTMDSLRSLASPTGFVTRSGETSQVPAKHIVPGDIVHIKMGDVVPADIRLFHVSNLEVDEALLTGEAMPVAKIHDVETRDQIAVGDRINMAFASTIVTRGRASGVVVATGMDTQVGHIAESMQKRKKRKKVDAEGKKLSLWNHIYESVATILGLRTGTPLQIKLNKLAYNLNIRLLLAADFYSRSLLIVFAVAKFHITNEVAIYAIALAIGVIPESLIAVLTITMATGTSRMAKSHVVVRQLNALEALGAVTDICSDKTGTLTAGKMIVRKFWLPSLNNSDGIGSNLPTEYVVDTSTDVLEPVGDVYAERTESNDGEEKKKLLDLQAHVRAKEFVLCASLCNVATLFESKEGRWASTGDPTEVALQVFATKLAHGRSSLMATESESDESSKQVDRRTERFVLKEEFLFNSDIKLMSTIYIDQEASEASNGRVVVYLKGAVERVLARCTHIYTSPSSAPIPLSSSTRDTITAQTDTLASQGLRVLALASRRPGTSLDICSDEELRREDVERDMCFIGLAGIYDPPRPESVHAVRACKRAGIVVHMLTGDHQATATVIARNVEIIAQDSPASAVMPASQFNAMSEAEIDALPELPLVIARCDPDTKVRMIEAGKRRGKYMAMTGDGVNDAPSLKLAPVGIGMGQGSDVAKSASELVLTDNNFDSIRAAIREGRRIFDNIQRFVLHLLATNVAEVILLICGLGFQDDSGESVYPLSPLAVLWLNMITGGPPAFGLGVEEAAEDVMTRPPQDAKTGVFSRAVIVDTFAYGFVMGVTTLMSFIIVLYGKDDGELGSDCNREPSASCDAVYKARSTVFATLTFEILLYAWELKSFRRSLFNLTPGRAFYRDLWANRVLFWAVVLGMASVPLCIYVPGLNDHVFYQKGITWEWGVVIGMTLVFVGSMEAWKLLVARRRGLRKSANVEQLCDAGGATKV